MIIYYHFNNYPLIIGYFPEYSNYKISAKVVIKNLLILLDQ